MKYNFKKVMRACITCITVVSFLKASDAPIRALQDIEHVVVQQNVKIIENSCKQLIDGIWYYQCFPSYFSTISRAMGYSNSEIKALEFSQSLAGMRPQQLAQHVSHTQINIIWQAVNKDTKVINLTDLRARTFQYTCDQLKLDEKGSYENNKLKIEANKNKYQRLYANCTAVSCLYEKGHLKN